MHRIVTGSFEDFEGAARGASALVAAGYGHGDVSIVARLPRRLRPAVALVAAAAGAMVASGSASAWAADAATLIAIAPSFGALAGACLGSMAAMLVERRARARTEEVRVLVDESRAPRVVAILRSAGAVVPRFAPFRP